MSVFEVFEQISEKNAVKSETGDPRIFGVMVGTVTKNYEDGIKGRVCVHIPTRDDDENEIRWAKIAQPSSGKGWGHFFVPEIGDQVLLAFEGGNIERPYVIGCIPRDNDTFISSNAKKENNIKSITTRSKTKIKIDDGIEEGENKKDASMLLEVVSDTQNHSILMDNEKGKIIIKDKSGGNSITMSTGKNDASGNGNIHIKAEANITLETGGTSIELNGKSNTITIKGDTFIFESVKSAKIKSQSINVEGSSVNIKGQNVKVEGSFTQVAGQTVKVGS